MVPMKLSSLFRGENAFLKGNFLILLITWILMAITMPIPATYESLYYLNLGANTFLLSVIGFAGSITAALVQIPGGYLADKHGRRWLIATMTYGLALGSVFFIIAPSWHFIVIGVVIQNLCLIYQPALFAILMDSLSPNNRGTAYNFQSVVTNLFSLPAPLIAQSLVLMFELDLGMRIAYTIVLVAYVVVATLRSRLKETLLNSTKIATIHIFKALREYPKSMRESIQVWNKLPKSAFYIFLSTVGINGLVVGCHLYFVVYATTILNITASQWAIVMTFMYFSIFLPAILAGLRMDRVGRKFFLVLGFLLYIPSMLLFVVADFRLLLVAFFLFGLAQVLQFNSSQVLLSDLIPRGLRGKAIGCMQFFMYVVQAIVQVIVGFLYAFVAPQLPFILLAAVALPLSLMVMYKVSEPKVKEV